MNPSWTSSNYPHYGQPYHAFVPPGYPNPFSPNTGNRPPPMAPPGGWGPGPDKLPPGGRTSAHNGGTHTFPGPIIPPNPDDPTGHIPSPPKPHIKRAATTGTPRQGHTNGPPLKSALKKTRHSEEVTSTPVMAPLERTRTTSSSRQRYTPTTRTGSNSNPQFMPDHMFVSFSGTNELRVHNVAFQDTLDVLREHVIPMWPHGVTTHSLAAHSWRVTFARNPWSASGQEGIIAQQMVCELFARLSHQGYQYLTSVNAGSSCGQLIFQDSQADENADFFVANFSSSGRRMTLVKPPRRIGEQIGARLRSAWPHKIAADRSSEQNIYTVELKRNSFGGPELDTNVFAAAALQEINFMGYKLEATVSFSRSSMWGFGGKKELWVFRGSKRSRPESRSGK